MPETQLQSFKATLHGDTRRFTVAGAAAGFATLMTMLTAAFKTAVSIKWVDEDGDEISVKNDDDLAECIATLGGDGGRATIRLNLAPVEAGPGSVDTTALAPLPGGARSDQHDGRSGPAKEKETLGQQQPRHGLVEASNQDQPECQGTPQTAQFDTGPAGVAVATVLVPDEHVSKLIGKQGSTIKHMQGLLSKSHIEIAEHCPPGQMMRKVLITGLAKDTEFCAQLVQEKLDGNAIDQDADADAEAAAETEPASFDPSATTIAAVRGAVPGDVIDAVGFESCTGGAFEGAGSLPPLANHAPIAQTVVGSARRAAADAGRANAWRAAVDAGTRQTIRGQLVEGLLACAANPTDLAPQIATLAEVAETNAWEGAQNARQYSAEVAKKLHKLAEAQRRLARTAAEEQQRAETDATEATPQDARVLPSSTGASPGVEGVVPAVGHEVAPSASATASEPEMLAAKSARISARLNNADADVIQSQFAFLNARRGQQRERLGWLRHAQTESGQQPIISNQAARAQQQQDGTDSEALVEGLEQTLWSIRRAADIDAAADARNAGWVGAHQPPDSEHAQGFTRRTASPSTNSRGATQTMDVRVTMANLLRQQQIQGHVTLDAVGGGVDADTTATQLAIHKGVACDETGQSPIVGVRYHLVGTDYDLCEKAFARIPEYEKEGFEVIDKPGSVPLTYDPLSLLFRVAIPTTTNAAAATGRDAELECQAGHLHDLCERLHAEVNALLAERDVAHAELAFARNAAQAERDVTEARADERQRWLDEQYLMLAHKKELLASQLQDVADMQKQLESANGAANGVANGAANGAINGAAIADIDIADSATVPPMQQLHSQFHRVTSELRRGGAGPFGALFGHQGSDNSKRPGDRARKRHAQKKRPQQHRSDVSTEQQQSLFVAASLSGLPAGRIAIGAFGPGVKQINTALVDTGVLDEKTAKMKRFGPATCQAIARVQQMGNIDGENGVWGPAVCAYVEKGSDGLYTKKSKSLKVMLTKRFGVMPPLMKGMRRRELVELLRGYTAMQEVEELEEDDAAVDDATCGAEAAGMDTTAVTLDKDATTTDPVAVTAVAPSPSAHRDPRGVWKITTTAHAEIEDHTAGNEGESKDAQVATYAAMAGQRGATSPTECAAHTTQGGGAVSLFFELERAMAGLGATAPTEIPSHTDMPAADQAGDWGDVDAAVGATDDGDTAGTTDQLPPPPPSRWSTQIAQLSAMGLGANGELVAQLLDMHGGDVERVLSELLG